MKIDYVELSSTDFESTRSFYSTAFGWTFQDWGPDYMSFSNAGVEGGFGKVEAACERGGVLIVLHTDDLDAAEKSIVDAGGEITERHEFPGGRRFHFIDTTGNELAVWTKAEE